MEGGEDEMTNNWDQGSVDGVFWYTKHVHYTLVWI
jgi:hypothetical protein